MPPVWTPTSDLGRAVYEAGFVYEPRQDIIYSRMDARQRSFGYAFGYDAASIVMSSVLDCEPIFFDYDGKHWMIELWKGQYGLETGCEIGVYTRSTLGPSYYKLFDKAVGDRGDAVASHNLYYDCAGDSDRLELKATLRRSGEVLFTRGPELHWWLTGFRWGVCSDPKQLSVDIAITLKDEAMRDAFHGGIAGRDYADYAVNGTTVSFTFNEAFAVPKPVPAWALAVAQAENRKIVDFYNETSRPNNDPNQVEAEYLKFVGLGFFHSRYVRGQRLSERAVEVVEPIDRSMTTIAADISSGLNVAPDTVERWLYNSQPVSILPDKPERYLAMTVNIERLDVDRATQSQNDFSCYVTIDNTRGPSDLMLTNYAATRGSYEVSPPPWIPRGGVARFVLADVGGLSAGTATYNYCDTSLSVKTVQFSFKDPRRRSSRQASSSQPDDWRCIETSGDPTFPQASPTATAGPLYVRYVINEHRQVACTRKNATGQITHLCGRPGTYWDPVEVADAISQIQRGEVAYFVRANDREALVQVVKGQKGPYLRKTPDGNPANNLTNLPSG
jgi:hypothetical protein